MKINQQNICRHSGKSLRWQVASIDHTTPSLILNKFLLGSARNKKVHRDKLIRSTKGTGNAASTKAFADEGSLAA